MMMFIPKTDDDKKLFRLLCFKGAVGDQLSPVEITGNPVSFNASAARNLKSMVIPFSPVQAGSGDPSPDNVRPISGFTGVNINRTGKSIIPFLKTEFPIGSGYVGYYGWCDQITQVAGLVGSEVTYSVEIDATEAEEEGSNNAAVWAQDASGSWVYLGKSGNAVTQGNKSVSSVKVAITDSIAWIAFGLSVKKGCVCRNPMVEVGSTATAYEPYVEPEIHHIEFPAVGKNLLSVPSFSLGGTEPRTKRVSIVPIPAGTYKLSGVKTGTSTANFGLQFFDAEVGGTNIGSGSIGSTITLSGEAVSVYAYMNQADYDESKTVILNELQLEEGSTATAFEPFTNTVYGGELDLTTGVLSVERASKSIRWGDTTRNPPGESMTAGYIALDYETKIAGESGVSGEHNCNSATWIWSGEANTTPHFYVYRGSSGKCTVLVYLPNGTDEDLNIVIVSKLKEPYTIQLDPVTIQTLKGDNTIWTDTNGENTIIYLTKEG